MLNDKKHFTFNGTIIKYSNIIILKYSETKLSQNNFQFHCFTNNMEICIDLSEHFYKNVYRHKYK